MRIAALINPLSRSVPENAKEQLSDLIGELGLNVPIFETTGKDIKSQTQEAISINPDVLVVWGGDGSVAFALTESGPDGPPVLALPGGTMNML